MAKSGLRAAAGSGVLYCSGIFGAWGYRWQRADSFSEYVLAIFQGLFWPVWMVYAGFDALYSWAAGRDAPAISARPSTVLGGPAALWQASRRP